MAWLRAKFKTPKIFLLVYFGGVVLLVLLALVTGETKSTPSPQTEVWILTASFLAVLNKTLYLNKFYM